MTILRANDVASVICARSAASPTAMKLQKLLYYAQAWHLAVTDRPLFAEDVQAYRDGPVVPEVRWARRERESRRPAVQQTTDIELDDLSSGVIDLIMAAYGSKSGDELSALTHDELPWREARGDLPEGANGNTAISKLTMADFYRTERKLGGRTAADLAAGGVVVEAPVASSGRVDIAALLCDLPEFETADPWGGANLHARVDSHNRRSSGTPREAR